MPAVPLLFPPGLPVRGKRGASGHCSAHSLVTQKEQLRGRL